jgi:hypothetical protein
MFVGDAPLIAQLLIWGLITIAASTFVVETAFIQVITYKGLKKRGLLLPEMVPQAYFWLIIGYPADIVFNEIRGRIMFRDWSSRGFLFTNRIQYYMDHPDKCKRMGLAIKWANTLNAIDPGHVRIPFSSSALGGTR